MLILKFGLILVFLNCAGPAWLTPGDSSTSTAAAAPQTPAAPQDQDQESPAGSDSADSSAEESEQPPAAASEKASITELAWLTGTWTGRQGKSELEEHWVEPKGGMMLAVNRTSYDDKGSFEFLRIQEKGDSLSYFASPAGRPAVEFPLKKLGKRRVEFENPSHDFPQRIVYHRHGKELHVTVEGLVQGNKRKMDWVWQRKED